jgi:hypothetical protein
MNEPRSAWGMSAVAVVMTATIAFAQVGLDSPKGNKSATNRPDSPVTPTDSRLKAHASTAAFQSSKQVSRAWYILSQTDANGLLHGLTARLAQALVGRRGPARLNVEIEFEGIDDGEIVLGFFTDPRWWVAEPTTIRRVHGRGKHLTCATALTNDAHPNSEVQVDFVTCRKKRVGRASFRFRSESYATMSFATFAARSVRRKSRSLQRQVSFSWSNPSR